MTRKFVWRIGVGGAVVAGVLLIAYATLQLPSVRARVLERARAYALRELGIVVDASSLHYALLARSIELRNVRLASAAGEPPFLQADAIRVVLDRGLLRGVVAVDRLDLVRPRLAIVRHANGTTNLPIGRSESSDAPLNLGVVSVRALTISLADESTGRDVAIGPLDLSLDTSSGTSRPGALGPSPFTVRLPAPEPAGIEPGAPARSSQPVTLSGTLAGGLAFDGVRVTVHDLRIDAAEGRLAARGFVDVGGKDPRLEIHAQLNADVARAVRLMPSTLTRPPPAGDASSIQGTVEAILTATGSVASPTLDLALTGDRLGYGSLEDVRLVTKSSLSLNRVHIHQLGLSSPSGSLQASGEIALSGENGASAPPAPSQLAVHWTDVDLDRALKSAGYTLPASIGTRASGRADLRLRSVDGTVDDLLSALAADASVSLQPISPASRRGVRLALGGQAQLLLKDGSWSVRHALTANASAASLAGTFTGRIRPGGNDSTLGGRAQLRIDDLATTVALLGEAGVSIPEPYRRDLKGSLEARLEPQGTIARPSVRATLSARDVRTADWPATSLDAALSVDHGGVRVQQLHARADLARLTASGDYLWNGRGNVRFDASVTDIGDLARRFQTTPLAMSGSARLEGHVEGTVDQPRGQATLTADNVAIDGTSIGRVGATLALGGARAQVLADAPALAVRAQLDLAIASPHDYEAEATFARTPIAALIPASFRDQITITEGVITGTVRSRGSLTRLLKSAADAEIKELEITLSGTPIKLQRSATLSATPDRISAEQVDLLVGKTTRVQVSGALANTVAAAPLQVRANGELTDLVAIAGPMLPGNVQVSPDGMVSLDMSVAGTLRAPDPSGTLTVRAASVGYSDLAPATDVALTATVDRTRVVLQTLGATWQTAKLSVEGMMPLRLLAGGGEQVRPWVSDWLSTLPEEPRSASLIARVTDITSAVLRPFLTPDRVREVDGKVAITITAEVDALVLERVRGSAVFDEGELVLAGVPFKQVVPTLLRLEKGHASIGELHWDSLGNAIRVSGGANLLAEVPRIDLAVNGLVDLRLLGAFSTDVAAGGIAQADFIVSGPWQSPDVVGRIGVKNGELRLNTPRVVASELEGSVRVEKGGTATIDLAGTVNGGGATLGGELDARTISDPRGTLTLSARNLALEYPEGLQTESNATLTLTLAPTGATLAGRIDVLGGSYREPLIVSSHVLSSWRQGIDPPERVSPFLSRLRLDLTLASVDDIRLDNNYGRLALSANLRIVGSAEQPGVIGRLEAAPDGEIYLAGNTYRTDRLIVDFANPRAIAPDLSFLATTRVGSTPIEVELQCTASGACERDVRSLAAGVTDEQAEAQLFGVSADPSAAGEQLARLLSGEVLGIVGRRVGLDTLRLATGGSGDLFDDPLLIAGDVDPASRLTLGKRLGDQVELVYSQNLAASGFTWSTTYEALPGLSFRGLLLDDQSRSLEFRHEPRFGVSRRERPERPPGARIGVVRFTGSPGFTERELRDKLKLEEGDRFEFAAWQRDRDQLASLYETRGFLEVRIRARRIPANPDPGNAVDLEYVIDRGPETRLDVRGATLPAAVRDRILNRWSSAVFDGFLERDARTIVRDHLYREGRLSAAVATAVTTVAAGGTKTLTIDINPGPVVPWRIEFAGNAQVETSRLHAAAADGLVAWLDPAAFELLIERVYREEGLLSAEVEVQSPEVRNGTSVVTAIVREGQPYLVGRVDVQGAGGLAETDVREALRVVSGARYQPVALADGIAQVERRFRQSGFLEARAAAATKVDGTDPRVDIDVVVEAGPRSILQDVVVDGEDAGKSVVTGAITLTPGLPIDPQQLGTTRRQLYDTGLYRSVEINLQPVSPSTTPPTADTPSIGDRVVSARIQLEKQPGYTLRYGLAFSDEVVGTDMREQRLGFAADLAKRNLFNPGTTAGFSARLRRDLQIGRVYLGSERFFGLPLRSNVFVSRSREQPDPGDDLAFVTDVTEVFGEQSYRLHKVAELRYGYGFGRNSTRIESLDFDVRFKVARLTSSALIDRRQDPFNPRGGWFSAAGVELSRPGLGSDISFLKGFLQYYHFVPIRPQWLVALAARAGLARTYEDQDLVPSERFFAGGATTVRGYREDDLGPRSQIGDNEAGGGNAMVILNAELRLPIYRWLRGVGFVDVGNVYPTVGDLSFTDLQTGIGAGLRFDSPVGIIRFDFGAPVNPRTFDPKWKVYFGLGHAF